MKTVDRNRDGKAAMNSFSSTPPSTRPRRPAHSKSNGKVSATTVAAASHLIGTLVGFSESNVPLVDFPSNASAPAGIAARTTVPLDRTHIGSEVVLLLAGDAPNDPIVMGRILPPTTPESAHTPPPSLDVELNGKRLELTAEDELVLRCGSASITLTKAGKVLIRGAYLLSRSSGVNRIKGGSVQIN